MKDTNKKKCFVIMPYGGNDPAAQKHFSGVFKTIISPAVRNAGYEPKRSDLGGEPGNITTDIIRDLADSEVVIADLTTGNPNVFFELGIRHAFRKSGTVHLVDKSHGLPFDLRTYRAIEYTDDMADVPDVQQKIEEAIQRRIDQPDRADNPVHDAIPELPIDLRSTGDKALTDQLRTAQEKLEGLRKENDKLTAELAQYRPATSTGDADDLDAVLANADAAMKSRGEFVILKLRQAMEEGPDQFVALLRDVLKSPYLTDNDFMEIVKICMVAGLDDHRRATLQVARQRYPYAEEIFLALVDALDDSPNPADRNRGRTMLEEALGIVHKDGAPVILRKAQIALANRSLAVLFNTYIRVRQYDWILSIIDSLPEPQREDAMVLRNRARALAKLGRLEEADNAYRKALELSPNDDQTYSWYSDFLDDQGKYHEAYELSEKAILADPEDSRLYLALAVDILNRGFHRNGTGVIEGPAPRNFRLKWAFPLILRAVHDRQPDLLQEAVRVLVRADGVREAQAIAANETPDGRYDGAPLDWLNARITARLEK